MKKEEKIKIKFYSFGLIVIILAIAGISVFFLITKSLSEKSIVQQAIQQLIAQKLEICEQTRKLDGLCFEGEEPLVYSVMIENHSASRPVSGIGQAVLVYEVVVEAPITRFLAIFYADNNLKKIGPVRSARPFFVDWATEFKAPYSHVGGSNEALDLLAKSYQYDLNEFSSGQYFWRKPSRPMPHNVYTSNELIVLAVQNKNWQVKNNFDFWKFMPESKTAVEPVAILDIKVDFGTNEYSVEWKYDLENKKYVRYQAGNIYKDSDGNAVTAKNVVLMFTDAKIIDDYGRKKIKTIGSGQAVVYRANEMIEAEWRRSSLKERTRFFDALGKEIAFYPGNTWIEVVAD
ncbi:MAG: DUF3048 domain-containing protein [Patescibacteria group bacterium]